MRNFLISAAVAASALAFASPAAAQYYPQSQGYGAPYGYGYNNGYGEVRRLQATLNSMQQQIHALDRSGRISNREARELRYRSMLLERQLRSASYDGLSRYERDTIAQRITRLGYQVRAEANEGRRWGNNDRRWDNNARWNRDGRGGDRRYDRDHDRWHDRNDDNRHDGDRHDRDDD